MEASENGGASLSPDPAPVLPYELRLNNSATHFTQREDGGMILHFTPAVAQPVPGGVAFALLPPQIIVQFDKDGWDTFKRDVAADGTKPRVMTAKTLPGQ